MLVVDAGCLYERLLRTGASDRIGQVLSEDEEWAAPHVVDVETVNLIRRERLLGRLDETAAQLAVDALQVWPGERFGHTALLPRVWELRHNVRGWDAFYVALAEVLGATLVTLDVRLANATGPRCNFLVP